MSFAVEEKSWDIFWEGISKTVVQRVVLEGKLKDISLLGISKSVHRKVFLQGK
jgi:hypothetical protein